MEPLNPEDPTLKIVVRREPLGVIGALHCCYDRGVARSSCDACVQQCKMAVHIEALGVIMGVILQVGLHCLLMLYLSGELMLCSPCHDLFSSSTINVCTNLTKVLIL